MEPKKLDRTATMHRKHDCVAVIPCFNEGRKICHVVGEVRKCIPKVIVVDDGSTDATAALASMAGAEVLKLSKNHGKGAALRHGWEHARKLGYEWVLMLDGDGQHAPDEIPLFWDCAERTEAALVVGNRMNNPKGMPPVRRFVNCWMSRWISKLAGTDLPDSQCGYRLAHLATLLSLPLHSNRFEIESAMLVAFHVARKKVAFVPIRTIYESSASKINPFTDTFRWLRWCLFQQTSLRACKTMRVPQ